MEKEYRTDCDININIVDVKEPDKDQTGEFDVNRIKIYKKSIKERLLEFYNNYNLSSKEVKERERTLIERIVWLVIFLFCFSYCICLIWKSYSKWANSPAIVLLSENAESISQIPFPAVTVCPERKINSTIFNFARYENKFKTNASTNGKFNEEDLQLYDDVHWICDRNYDAPKQMRNFSHGNETMDNIKKVSMQLSKVVYFCIWMDKVRRCSHLFTPVVTDEGICYTFNMIGPKDLFRENLNTDYEFMDDLDRIRLKGWTAKAGYVDDASEDTYPRRNNGAFAGAKTGLRLLLGQQEDGIDLGCMGMLSGYKLLLHNPTELPRLSQQYCRIPVYEEVTIGFTAKKIITSEGLLNFPFERRQCYTQDERYLRYFKIYTQSNCEYECLSNFTYERCGCVVFSMPHDHEMNICNIRMKNCTDRAEIDLSTVKMHRKLKKKNGLGKKAISIANNCMCLPTCTSITYESEISQLGLDHTRREIKFHRLTSNKVRRIKVSAVVIFFKRAVFDIKKRSELYSTSDILASCGGLLGLFMGFSVINVIETLYFCILRIHRQRRNQGVHHTDSGENVD